MPTITGQFTTVNFLIAQDDDWIDPLPQLLWQGLPLDLAGKTVELIIRPDFGSATRIARLATDNGGIAIMSPASGTTGIAYPQASVAALPIGAWKQFLRVLDPSASLGWTAKEWWRGSIRIAAGSLAT